jgi:twitching motility protein PilT
MEITDLLRQCIEKKASDLHVSPEMPPLLRIDGELERIQNMPVLTADQSKEMLYKILTPEEKKEFESDLELDLAMAVPGLARFRVNVFHEMNGIGAVFRTIPEVIPTLDELQLPAVFKQLLDLPNGLILVTGPTGSGKSTTLAAMVDYINTHQSCHIITIEDPIEFRHTSKKSLINQRQIHRDTRDFTAALRAALREDPDVILVGELRDLETIRLALTAAETGHLVMGTLHTTSAPRTISRIVDVFSPAEKNIIRNMLSESLQAVICQTLLKKMGGGRVAAFEIMLGTSAIRNLIREDKVAQMYSTIQTGSELGMCTLDQYLQGLIKNQMIDTTSAREIAVSKDSFVSNG